MQLTPILFAILFPTAWVLVSLFISHMGGWSSLAAQYPDADDSGTSHFVRSGMVGSVSYGSCLGLRVCTRTSDLNPVSVLRWASAVFIPWDQFHSVSEKRIFFRFLSTYVGRPVVANIVLPLWLKDHVPRDQEPP